MNTIKIKNRALALVLMIAALAAGQTLWAQALNHKIVVIADPHVMGNGLLTNTSNADWTTYLAGSRKLIDKSQTLFDQTVTVITGMAEKPELVLIVGDLTKDGEQASHNYVQTKLAELKTAGIQALVIPGNHDLGTTDAKVYGETTTAATTIANAAAFATQYADYGYGLTSTEREATTLTYACEPIPDLVVIGIDSGTDGTLSNTTLDWVCEKAVAARAAGKQVIAMMHHPLIPHITGGETFVETVSVANSATVRNRLADAGITTIFTGHFHTSDIAKDWNADKSKTIYDVTTGSLCSYPCDYRVVTLNNTMNKMSIATETATGDATITAADAKTRLTNSMKTILTAKLTSQGLDAGNAATLALHLSEAYVFHAEGNENLSTGENSAASCLNDIQVALGFLNTGGVITDLQYTAFMNMLTSMLQDKSNYGTDREDQTNDRTLTDINIPLTWVGSGTKANPYLIKSTIQLNLLAELVNAGNSCIGKYFKLANDITYTHTTDWNDTDSDENNYTAIGNNLGGGNVHPFSGTFDGDGHTISGIRIYKDGNDWADAFQGLFGYVDKSTVKNVTLADTRITGEQMTGGVVGWIEVKNGISIIENCHVLSDVVIHAVVNNPMIRGGIAGYNCGTIRNCTSAATLTVKDGLTNCQYFGGIAGYNSEGTLTGNLVINANISGQSSLGAILGYNDSGTLENNYYSGCTVGGATSNIGCDGADITENDGAVLATILSDAGTTLPALSEGDKVAFRREFTVGKASTVVFPFEYTPGTEGTYYAFSGVTYDDWEDKWVATMASAVTPLEANTPYLFMPEGTNSIVRVLFHGAAVASISAGSTTSGDWQFKGVYTKKTWAAADCGRDYGFAATSGKATDGVTDVAAGDFVKFAEGAWLRPMRSYLTYTGEGNPWAAGARSSEAEEWLPQTISVVLVNADGSTTSLNEELRMNNEEFATAAGWFTLDGRKLDSKPTKKGIYISNGRKVVIK